MKTKKQILDKLAALEKRRGRIPTWSTLKDENGERLRDPLAEELEAKIVILHWVLEN